MRQPPAARAAALPHPGGRGLVAEGTPEQPRLPGAGALGAPGTWNGRCPAERPRGPRPPPGVPHCHGDGGGPRGNGGSGTTLTGRRRRGRAGRRSPLRAGARRRRRTHLGSRRVRPPLRRPAWGKAVLAAGACAAVRERAEGRAAARPGLPQLARFPPARLVLRFPGLPRRGDRRRGTEAGGASARLLSLRRDAWGRTWLPPESCGGTPALSKIARFLPNRRCVRDRRPPQPPPPGPG